jgi:hypothetical protein
MSTLIFLTSLGGGSGTQITVVNNYNALLALPPVTGAFYWCENSQGTSWLPGSLGGTYYPKGVYYCANSVGPILQYIETPYQATQADVDAGTITDQFVSPKTFNDSSQLTSKQNNAIVVSSNQVAVNNAYYINVANATYTDPSPVEGLGYEVDVLNATATINSIAYSLVGTTITRRFHSGAWITNVSLPNSSFVLNSSSAVLSALGWFNIQNQTPGTTSSGTSNTISKSIALPFVPTTLKFRSVGNKTNSNGTFTIRVYLSEVDNNIGGTAILIATLGSSLIGNNFAPIKRDCNIVSGNIKNTLGPAVSSVSDDTLSGLTPLNVPIPTGTPLYLIFAVQCASASDTARIESVEISNF